nr:MAG TPA: hypothetical protein [Caudoviricetes sp.]
MPILCACALREKCLFQKINWSTKTCNLPYPHHQKYPFQVPETNPPAPCN